MTNDEESAVSMMAHAIQGGYRNHYCAEVVSPAWSQWCGLVVLGLARYGFRINDGRDQYFHVTDAGRAYVQAHGGSAVGAADDI
jgi:hypothetical protein